MWRESYNVQVGVSSREGLTKVVGKSRVLKRTGVTNRVVDVEYEKILWGTGKTMVMISGFYALIGLVCMFKRGIYGSELVKKRRY